MIIVRAIISSIIAIIGDVVCVDVIVGMYVVGVSVVVVARCCVGITMLSCRIPMYILYNTHTIISLYCSYIY